jgi:hypothetical protein
MYQRISLRFMAAASKIGKDGKASLLHSIIVNKSVLLFNCKRS